LLQAGFRRNFPPEARKPLPKKSQNAKETLTVILQKHAKEIFGIVNSNLSDIISKPILFSQLSKISSVVGLHVMLDGYNKQVSLVRTLCISAHGTPTQCTDYDCKCNDTEGLTMIISTINEFLDVQCTNFGIDLN